MQIIISWSCIKLMISIIKAAWETTRFAITVNSRECVVGGDKEWRWGTCRTQKGAQRQRARDPCPLRFLLRKPSHWASWGSNSQCLQQMTCKGSQFLITRSLQSSSSEGIKKFYYKAPNYPHWLCQGTLFTTVTSMLLTTDVLRRTPVIWKQLPQQPVHSGQRQKASDKSEQMSRCLHTKPRKRAPHLFSKTLYPIHGFRHTSHELGHLVPHMQ